MIDQDHPRGPETTGQGKLVLPPQLDFEDAQSAPDAARGAQTIQPEMLVRRPREVAPKKLTQKLVYYWHKDPAYKVLMIALVLVLVSSVVLAAVLGSSLMQNGFFGNQTAKVPLTPPPGVAPTGTVDVHPTFTTPGGHGSTQSSQPPTQSTPSLQPSPTQGTGTGDFSVQISGVPGVVPNNSDVPVTITTSEPNVQVQLRVTYNVAPFFFSDSAVTDGGGNAQIDWRVQVFQFGRRAATATLQVFAVDQNGHTASSSPVRVRISGGGE